MNNSCPLLGKLQMPDKVESGLPSLRVYSRPGCHLCEQLVEEMAPLVRGRLRIEVVDIDSCPDWQRSYGSRIPVVEFKSEFVCQYSLDVVAIQRILTEHEGLIRVAERIYSAAD